MNKHLLSIDPSMDRTGFTLWEQQWTDIEKVYSWKPIWIESYSFNKYGDGSYQWNNIKDIIEIKCNNNIPILVIERGFRSSKNGKGVETLEHLRGFIAGQFDKLPDKKFQEKYMPLPNEWRKTILYRLYNFIDFKPTGQQELLIIGMLILEKKLKKEDWLWIAYLYYEYMKWETPPKNHDEAESLLIGWDFITKEKWES
jgi:hypothetical protein